MNFKKCLVVEDCEKVLLRRMEGYYQGFLAALELRDFWSMGRWGVLWNEFNKCLREKKSSPFGDCVESIKKDFDSVKKVDTIIVKTPLTVNSKTKVKRKRGGQACA